MVKKTLSLLVLGLIIFSFNFSSANFACGKVNDYDNLSANWLNAKVWYNDNISESINCTINPENKFCCDLDELKSTKFTVGKKVSAEIFRESESYVSNLVELTTTSDSYSLFPEIKLQEAIKIINKSTKILINQTEANISVSLAEGYGSLSYNIINNNGSSNVSVCTNCMGANISIPLLAGENKVILITQGRHSIRKNLVFYNLEYLNISRKISCVGCKENKDNLPAKINSTITIKINSSHPIDEEITEFFPVSFTLLSENYTEYSASHNFFTKQINGSYLEYSYIVKAPNVLMPRKYIFKTQMDGFSKSDTTLINKNWFSLYIKNGFVESEWLPNKFFYVSPNEPLIIKEIDSRVSLIGVFPKEESSAFYRVITKESSSEGKVYKVITNLPDEKISKIFVRLTSENTTNLSLYAPEEVILSVSNEGGKKTYEGYINMREFEVRE